MPPAAPAVVALANYKGGVGKTTTTTGLADALVRAGYRVTVVDSDPQHSFTRVVDIDPEDPNVFSLYDLMDRSNAGAALDAAAVPTKWGFKVVPAADELQERTWAVGDEFILRKAIAAGADADIVLIDCPPSLGMLNRAAAIAAQHVVLVTQATFVDLEAASAFVGFLALIREHYNPALGLTGCIVNRYESTIDQDRYLPELRKAMDANEFFPGTPVWEPEIKDVAAAQTMTGAGETLAGMRRYGAAELASVYGSLAAQLAAAVGATPTSRPERAPDSDDDDQALAVPS